MSEVKLNLVDAERVLHGTIRGFFVDSCVAALSAEPETIPELQAALARYVRPDNSHEFFACFHSTRSTNLHVPPEIDAEPWDAGLVVIDLAARIVATESTYSQPGLDGSHMDDEFAFSSCKTRAEWELENRRREEFAQEFDRKMAERKRRLSQGEEPMLDPFFHPEPF